ncbi:MAG: hypothetical protein RDV48_27325 [Candidatus Eremiobacteraeota bacterium]|nr:hypothetical protein [Candidatus Eremiobacteraeota bacterium]
MILPCPFVLLLDRGYDILNGFAEWDGLHEAIPHVRALMEQERSHITYYAHFALYFPVVREICDSLESTLNELGGILQSLEHDRGLLSSMLSAFEENAVTLVSLQHALERAFNEIPRNPPVPTICDAIFTLSCFLRGEVQYDILPYWLSGLGELRKRLAMDLAPIRLRAEGKEKLRERLEEVVALLRESEDIFSRCEREKKVPDIEQLTAILGKTGEQLSLILPEMEDSSSLSFKDLKSRYGDTLSLLITRYREGSNVINDIRDYIVYLKEIEEKRIESLEKEKNYWYLSSNRQEEFFSDMAQCCRNKTHLLEAMHLHLHDPLEVSRLFSQYSALSGAERDRLGELKRELEEDISLENAPYFKNLSNVMKSVFQCRLPLHHLATHLAHALRMQEDLKTALIDCRVLQNESSDEVDALLQAVRLQEEGAGKIKEFLQRRERDLLIEGKNLMIQGIKMIKIMDPADDISDSALTPINSMLKKFSVISDDPKCLIDIKEDQDHSRMPAVEKKIVRENIRKLKQALTMGECNEISGEEEKKVFSEFLQRLTSLQNQMEDQVTPQVKSFTDTELEKTCIILREVIAKFRIITEEIVRLLEEGAVPPAHHYCGRIEEIAQPLDELQQVISEILAEKQRT